MWPFVASAQMVDVTFFFSATRLNALPPNLQNRDGNSFTRSRPNTFIPNIAPWIDSQGTYFQNKEARICFQPIHAKAPCICSRSSPSSWGYSATRVYCVCNEVPLGPLEIFIFFLPSWSPDVLLHGTRYNGGRLSLLHVTVGDPTLADGDVLSALFQELALPETCLSVPNAWLDVPWRFALLYLEALTRPEWFPKMQSQEARHSFKSSMYLSRRSIILVVFSLGILLLC